MTRKYINRCTRRRQRTHRRRQRQQGGELDEQAKQAVAQSMAQREENRAKWLQVACRNPDNCLALGVYGDAIKNYFDHFQSFSYLDQSKVKRIGAPSVNGFIIEMPYTKNGYTAYTALKSSARATSDNLLYEYIVGKRFINKWNKILPVFLETYDLYEYVDETAYDEVKTATANKTLHQIDLSTKLRKMNLDVVSPQKVDDFAHILDQACLKNKLACFTIQHFDNFESVYEHLTGSREKYKNVMGDIWPIMFQVYNALNVLRNFYTHYDLHTGNVMLYKPFPGKKCILMKYHVGNTIVEFKTEYIPKIIDYGRNYFKQDGISTRDLMNLVCASNSCQPKCGEKVGMKVIVGSTNGTNASDFYWIDPSKRNMSHDLRFANCVFNETLNIQLTPPLIYEDSFGTPEQTSFDLNTNGNVYTMFMYVFGMLKNGAKSNRDKYDDSWEVVATMDVYADQYHEYTFNVLPSATQNPLISSPPLVTVPIT